MNTCSDCKYKGDEQYVEEDDGDEYQSGYFRCEFIKHDENRRYPNGEGAVVVDGSGYFAALLVEDAFGCVHYKSKADLPTIYLLNSAEKT